MKCDGNSQPSMLYHDAMNTCDVLTMSLQSAVSHFLTTVASKPGISLPQTVKAPAAAALSGVGLRGFQKSRF